MTHDHKTKIYIKKVRKHSLHMLRNIMSWRSKFYLITAWEMIIQAVMIQYNMTKKTELFSHNSHLTLIDIFAYNLSNSLIIYLVQYIQIFNCSTVLNLIEKHIIFLVYFIQLKYIKHDNCLKMIILFRHYFSIIW